MRAFSLLHSNTLLLAAALMALFCIQASIGKHWIPLLAQNQKQEDQLISEEALKPDPDFFKALSFGHTAVAIDLVWLKILQDESMKKVKPGEHQPLFYRLDLLSDLDPLFYEVYFAGANLLSVVRDDGTGARDLLLKGTRYWEEVLSKQQGQTLWTSPWQLYMLLGYVYLYDLKDLPNASVAFEKAARLPGSPEFLQALVARLSKPGGSFEVALRLVKFLRRIEKNPQVQHQLDENLETLDWKYELWKLEQQYRHPIADFLKKASRLTRGSAEYSAAWDRFVRQNPQIPQKDPWGGAVILSPQGQLQFTTVREGSFGL